MKKLGFKVLLAALLLVLLAVPVFADDPEGDVVIWGDNYTLAAGHKINGDLLVYGGNADLQAGSEVDGDVTVFGGSLTIAGDVDGDITVWGGSVHILASATVRGKVMSISGSVNSEEGADVRGEKIEGLPFRDPVAPKPPVPPEPPVPPQVPNVRTRHGDVNVWLHNVTDAFRSAFGILVLIVLSILVVVFIPRHTDTVAETMVKAPLQSFAVGLAAWIVVPIVAVVLTVTICLSPVAALLTLVAGVALLFGWIAAGLLLGVRLLRALTKTEPNPVAAVALGTGVLTVLSFIPCLGFLISAVALTWSLGAVAHSFFGTRRYNDPLPKMLQPKPHDPRQDRL